MTTPAAEKLHQAQHNYEVEGKQYAIYNPHNKPLEELPLIMGFNNGGMERFLQAIAIAEDGYVLGQHCCSHECYMPHDLGILEGAAKYRHEEYYQKYYPNGYRMEFVSLEDERLQEALKLNNKLAEETE